MEYAIKENNNTDWLNKGSRYNTDICSKLHGNVFDDFIRNDITDRCNIMCSKTPHGKLQTTYVDYANSVSGREITKNERTAAL